MGKNFRRLAGDFKHHFRVIFKISDSDLEEVQYDLEEKSSIDSVEPGFHRYQVVVWDF